MRSACDENALALYVEGDLERGDAAALERHLGECAGCRAFLEELRESQQAVRDLAAEPLDEPALAAVRARVASGREPGAPLSRVAWPWAVAASVVAAAGAAVWLAAPTHRAPTRARVAEAPSAAPSITAHPAVPGSVRTSEPPVRATSTRRERSTPRTHRAVSRGVVQADPVPRLSPEDADQLARAVVAMSRIHSVEDALREAEPQDPSPAPLVRIATADPDVVIYWRLETNGGE